MSCLFEKLLFKRSSPSPSPSPSAALVGNNKDVVGEILSRLPMSSVIRFRLVCKEWRSLTSTQLFLEMHENNNPSFSHDNNSCFVVQYFDAGTEFTSISDHFNILFFNIDTQLYSASATNNNNKMKKKKKRLQMVREYIGMSRRRGGKYYNINLISSYRGFLVFKAKPTDKAISRLQEDGSALIFYNPVTKEQLTVTAPSNCVYCGFYYHSPTKEYRILYHLIVNQAGRVAEFFQVCSLQTKILRNLKAAPSNAINEYCYYPDPSTPPVISNGSLHWVVSEDNAHRHRHHGTIPPCSHTILSFGMESEEVRLMPHPTFSHACIHNRHNMYLMEMEVGILCLCDSNRTDKKLEIYVMEDYKKWTWVRRFLIDLGYVCIRDRHLHYPFLDYKALQIRHGVILFRFYDEYILYPLNQQEDYDDPSSSCCGMVMRKSNIDLFEEQLECTFPAADIYKKKKKKRERFQVKIGRNWIYKLGRFRRMKIKHPTPGDRPYNENPSASVRSLMVLTPSLASLRKSNK